MPLRNNPNGVIVVPPVRARLTIAGIALALVAAACTGSEPSSTSSESSTTVAPPTTGETDTGATSTTVTDEAAALTATAADGWTLTTIGEGIKPVLALDPNDLLIEARLAATVIGAIPTHELLDQPAQRRSAEVLRTEGEIAIAIILCVFFGVVGVVVQTNPVLLTQMLANLLTKLPGRVAEVLCEVGVRARSAKALHAPNYTASTDQAPEALPGAGIHRDGRDILENQAVDIIVGLPRRWAPMGLDITPHTRKSSHNAAWMPSPRLIR